jgi:hypothetical protein
LVKWTDFLAKCKNEKMDTLQGELKEAKFLKTNLASLILTLLCGMIKTD